MGNKQNIKKQGIEGRIGVVFLGGGGARGPVPFETIFHFITHTYLRVRVEVGCWGWDFLV